MGLVTFCSMDRRKPDGGGGFEICVAVEIDGPSGDVKSDVEWSGYHTFVVIRFKSGPSCGGGTSEDLSSLSVSDPITTFELSKYTNGGSVPILIHSGATRFSGVRNPLLDERLLNFAKD
jgi:hypothetical protein